MACGCRIEGPAGGVADWLRGPDLERAVAPYCKADLLRGLNRDVLLKEDASVESRCSEAFAAVKRFEESHKVAAQVLCLCPCCESLRCAVLGCAVRCDMLRCDGLCAALCCAVTGRAVLCCAVLCCAVLCCAVLRYAALRCAALRRAALLCSALLNSAALCKV